MGNGKHFRERGVIVVLNETDEDYHQMSFEDYFRDKVKPNLFAVSRVFAEARKQMNLAEYKVFTYALTNIRWQDPCPDTLYVDKKVAAQLIDMKSDATDLSQHLKRAIGDLPVHSYLKFSDKDSGTWVNGCFVSTIAFFKNRLRIRMNPDYLDLFGRLDKGYINMWSADIYKMHSERSVKFYELLRENSDTREDINVGTMGIKAFKELFDIPKDGPGSYMRDAKNGGFNRQAFERRIIDPVFEDLTHTEMIHLTVQPDGKLYEKVKSHGRIIGYRFYWTISMYPRVASAEELHEVNKLADKNPKVLKVAKDLANGIKHSKKSKSKTSGGADVSQTGYSDYGDEHSYNYDDLEYQLAHLGDNEKINE